MEPPKSFQPYLDELISFASSESRKEALLAAKGEYFRLTGEVFEDDKLFEQRMASFLDYYVFDRRNAQGKTPAEEFLEQRAASAAPEAVSAYQSFTGTLHGLFEVRKLGKGSIRLRELYSGKDYDVTERRHVTGLQKGDILEARLIPFNSHLLFSGAFCYHPKVAAPAIRKEIKRRKKEEPEKSGKELAWDCARMALKVDRYRQVAVDKIYDFQNKKL
jgi:hypothetical protein